MTRIGIVTCSNATQDLGCCSASCLADLRKRRGTFGEYPAEEELVLAGIINCPGCPTLTGPEKLLQRIKGLAAFRLDAIHLTYCVKALCPFVNNYQKALAEAYPDIKIVIGTHQEHLSPEEYRARVKKLFCQERKNMADVILGRD
jgi:predicted metal-binding protein